jgi:hypothetical protein
MEVKRKFPWEYVLVVSFVVFVLGSIVAGSWYEAGIKQRVWARQGCQMTRWEILWGAQPITRNIVTEEKQ